MLSGMTGLKSTGLQTPRGANEMREIASSRTIERGFTSPQSKVKSRKSRVKNDGPRVQWESRAVRHKAREQNPSGVLAYLAPSGRHRGGSDCFLLSAFCFLLSAFCFLLSAFCFLLSAFCFLLSAFCFPTPGSRLLITCCTSQTLPIPSATAGK